MTADAKVGLLLGLFFIVVIAFLVNGLPNFIKAGQPEDIQDVTIPAPIGPDLPLDNQVSRAVEQLRPVPLRPRVTEPPQEVVILDSPKPQVSVPDRIVFENEPTQPTQTVEDIRTPQLPNPNRKQQPVIHVVQSDENLAVIAKKYYGKEEGNRHIVIQKLYEFNSDVIKSINQVRVGDKLKVPPFEQLMNPEKAQAKSSSASDTLLKKFSNVFERVNGSNSGSVTEYIVKEDDNLWSIAEEMLGNGARYSEIVRLNKIRNADQVPAGTRLKIPAK